MTLSITRRMMSLAVLGAVAAFALSGCTAAAAGDASAASDASADSATTPAVPAPASTPDTADSLKALVLTTTEIPVGGWTPEGDTSSSSTGAETSKDASGPGACGLDLSAQFDLTQPTAGQRWSRASTDSTLVAGVQADPAAKEHVESLATALAACPPSSHFTKDGSPTTVKLSVVDLGSFGDAHVCFAGDTYANVTDVYLTQCLVAVGPRVVGTVAIAKYAAQKPSDGEVAKITAAAVAKVVAAG
jgi:hypothetical protein